ncbi:hypothetical protein LN474_05400 [Xanthomonas codiaei]|nr:hypothetical protein [Xanthomonas codiaei]
MHDATARTTPAASPLLQRYATSTAASERKQLHALRQPPAITSGAAITTTLPRDSSDPCPHRVTARQ